MPLIGGLQAQTLTNKGLATPLERELNQVRGVPVNEFIEWAKENMSTKFDSFLIALEALCVEHKVALDNETSGSELPRLRVFDAEEGENHLTINAFLADFTNQS